MLSKDPVQARRERHSLFSSLGGGVVTAGLLFVTVFAWSYLGEIHTEIGRAEKNQIIAASALKGLGTVLLLVAIASLVRFIRRRRTG